MRAVIRVQRREPDHVRSLLHRSSSDSPSNVNYEARNYRSLRRLQAGLKVKSQAQSLSPPPPFKLTRFAQIGALVFKDSHEVERLRAERKVKHTLAREHGHMDQVLSQGNRNYVLENAKEAILAAPKSLPVQPLTSVKTLNPNYGKVPAYLKKYIETAEEERRRRKEAELIRCPPGMRLLAEEERSGLYEAMVKERQSTLLSLNRVPLGASSPSILRRKNLLERRLEELDKSILTFSQPKVFIAK